MAHELTRHDPLDPAGLRRETRQGLQHVEPEYAREAGPNLRLFFCNLEEALAVADNKSFRREATQFMPIRDQVLVYVCEKEQMSDGGNIIIPDSAQEKQSEGIVIAVGPGAIDANNIFIPTVVRPRDRVLHGKYAGTDIVLRGKKCRLMLEREILGVIAR